MSWCQLWLWKGSDVAEDNLVLVVVQFVAGLDVVPLVADGDLKLFGADGDTVLPVNLDDHSLL